VSGVPFLADAVLVAALFAIGTYMVVAKSNLLKKLIGLNIMQTAVFAFLVAFGRTHGADPPVLGPSTAPPYADPLPQAMVLTGIVVAVAVSAVALSLIAQIHAHVGTIEVADLKERP
jgi:multicomponent Na+:H+ antiporter subunit C